jgi:hypothetical protein
VIAAADGSGARGRALAVVDDVEIRFTMSKSHASSIGIDAARRFDRRRCGDPGRMPGAARPTLAERLLSRPRQAQPRRAQTKTPPSFGLRRARWGPRFKDLMRAELGHARTLRARCRGEGPIADLLAWQPVTAMRTHPDRHVRDERGQAGGAG